MRRLLPLAISSRLPTVIQRAGRFVGLEIRANNPYARDELRLARMLQSRDVDLVFDVGANRGQFARGLFAAGYTGQIVSFEAVAAAHANLLKRATKSANNWTIEPLGALSDKAGEVEFHINSADTTSSLLPPSASSACDIAELQPTSVVRVPARRLDDVAPNYGIDQRRSFLKMDVQGGEAIVLAGAQESLRKVIGLVVELSFTELYAGQPLAFDVLQPLLDAGFAVHDIYAAYRNPETYHLVQADFVLFRADQAGRQR